MVAPQASLRAVFAGLATFDLVHRVEAHLGANEKATALRQDLAAGGPAANAAVAFAALGGHAILLTALGAHPLATLIRSELEQCGVEVLDATPHERHLPPVSSIRVVTSSGERSVSSVNAAGRDPEAPPLPSSDVVLVDGHLPRLAHAAARLGAPVVLDGGSWKPVLDELLPLVTYSVNSAEFVAPAPDLLQRGVHAVVTTDGARPVRWRTPAGSGAVDVPETAVRDTLGAGDAFHGAFAYAVARGAALLEAIRFAIAVARVRVRHIGPRGWLADPELLALRGSV